MKKIICYFLRHKSDDTKCKLIARIPFTSSIWQIECVRCGRIEVYQSPFARLIGKELELGFGG